VDVVEASRGSQELEDAAQIWAEATAFRDGESDVADLADSLPILEAVLDRSPQSFVLLAQADGGVVTGFVAVEPVAGTTSSRAQVSFLGVRPSMWGRGVAQLLLRQVRSRLANAGYIRAELLVYVTNVRAVALYERLGWKPVGTPTPHPRTGMPEQRYELAL
jgi:ribosomal protein S18 acetylase RimI-like enzyme